MRRVIPITEQYQHSVADLQGSFWGDCYGQVRRLVNAAVERESIRLREVYLTAAATNAPATVRSMVEAGGRREPARGDWSITAPLACCCAWPFKIISGMNVLEV